MARLNEGPDAIEALKRRFIRQNREIARVNSQQSQRIRNLEIEISRLLAENISIREEAIAIRNEAAQNRGHKLARDVQALKARMVQKLAEVTGIVEELDVVSTKTRRRSGYSRNIGYSHGLPTTPDEEKEDWTTKRPIRDVQEPAMPPILEDKAYPRRTLEKDAAIFQTSDLFGAAADEKHLSESPSDPINNPSFRSGQSSSELANSTILDALLDGQTYEETSSRSLSHLNSSILEREESERKYEPRTASALRRRSTGFNSDGSTLNQSRNNDAQSRCNLELTQAPPQTASTDATDAAPEPAVSAQVNVETRRKRRTSALMQPATELADTQRTEQAAQAHTNPPEIAGPAIKAGAKRRLSMSELQESNLHKGVSKELDDFIYQRKQASAVIASKPSRFTARPSTIAKDQDSSAAPATKTQLNTTTATRKILAPKSINSPSKKRMLTVRSKLQDSQVDSTDVRDHRPASRTTSRAEAQKDVENCQPLNAYNKPAMQQTALKSTSRPPASVEKLQPITTVIEPTDTDAIPPPKTPAVELATDLFSPPDSAAEPSNVRKVQELAQTNNSVEDVLNGSIGRGSRRARAAVSYAEPNLRDKMRRDGARVSAVDGEVSRRRSTAI